MNTSIIDKASELRETLILSNVVESYGVSLSGIGSELKGLCPFHSGIHPQF
ncbi:MAG: hypothetical protein VKK42_29615 [Lyngbya sp.]|nr:hypothetical protein [Lyngbya sp.]